MPAKGLPCCAASRPPSGACCGVVVVLAGCDAGSRVVAKMTGGRQRGNPQAGAAGHVRKRPVRGRALRIIDRMKTLSDSPGCSPARRVPRARRTDSPRSRRRLPGHRRPRCALRRPAVRRRHVDRRLLPPDLPRAHADAPQLSLLRVAGPGRGRGLPAVPEVPPRDRAGTGAAVDRDGRLADPGAPGRASDRRRRGERRERQRRRAGRRASASPTATCAASSSPSTASRRCSTCRRGGCCWPSSC